MGRFVDDMYVDDLTPEDDPAFEDEALIPEEDDEWENPEDNCE